MWSQEMAIFLCRQLEEIAPKYGCHVALTGGCLYKDGERKDVDILFYRIRQVEEIDIAGLVKELEEFGVVFGKDHGWVYKATWCGNDIDFFFPERPEFIAMGDGVYVPR